jgi:sortase A
MLSIKHKRTSNLKRAALSVSAMSLLGGGLYMLSLVAAPIAAPILTMKPIDVKTLPSPEKTGDRIVIPKIGVNIAYGKGEAALDSGAEWRMPGNGNPSEGGNFVIAAHRFSIQPTPLATIEKSPFYHIDKLANGDKVLIDYQGKRYGYEILRKFTVKPTQIEIEARTTEPTLTLYSCGLEGSEVDRLVIEAKKLGEVALEN